MKQKEADLLSDAYRDYRARIHRRALQEESAVVDLQEFREVRGKVADLWKQWMEG